MTKKFITLTELADSLNLSKQLIKVVLAGKGDEFGISRLTQETIIKKAQELGFEYQKKYYFDSIEIKTISLITSAYLNSFHIELIKCLKNNLSKEKINFTIQFINKDKENYDLEKLLFYFVKAKISGIINTVNFSDISVFEFFKNEDIILFQILNECEREDVAFIGYDCEKMMNEVLNYLIDKGHKKIAFICYNENNSLSSKVFYAYKNFLEKTDLYNEFYYKKFNFESYHQEILKFLKECKEYKLMPTCIILPDENAVLKLFDACKELKINLPSQLSIISLSDSEVLKYLNPPVTSVSIPVISIAEKTSEYLIKNLRTSKEPEKVHLKFETNLILRNSVLQVQ